MNVKGFISFEAQRGRGAERIRRREVDETFNVLMAGYRDRFRGLLYCDWNGIA